MVKSINEVFEDNDFYLIKKAKGALPYRAWMIKKAKEDLEKDDKY